MGTLLPHSPGKSPFPHLSGLPHSLELTQELAAVVGVGPRLQQDQLCLLIPKPAFPPDEQEAIPALWQSCLERGDGPLRLLLNLSHSTCSFPQHLHIDIALGEKKKKLKKAQPWLSLWIPGEMVL